MSEPRYQNGMIYKLVNSADEQFYIGSTCLSLAKRKSSHKKEATKCPDQRVYKHLNDVGWANVDIILIEKFPCADKNELEKRQRHWIETLKPSLNKNIPTRLVICEHNRQRVACADCKPSLLDTVQCECGRTIQIRGLRVHIKSSRHAEDVSGSKSE